MPFGRVTALVGPNGSGKSNLLDALKFLQGAALDLPLGEVLRGRYEGQREVWPGIRGGAAEAARTGTPLFYLMSVWRAAHAIVHGMSVDAAGGARTHQEMLSVVDGAGPLWMATTGKNLPTHLPFPGGQLDLTFLDPSTGKPVAMDSHRMAASQVLAEHAAPAVLDHTAELLTSLRELVFLDVQPWRMRDYRPEGAAQIGINGENISPVLRQLGEREPEQLQNVVDWLTELCSPAIEKIDFDRTQLGEVMMFLVEPGGRKISARSTSDGTLRFLGLIVALLTIPEGSIIILEEPDVGLHPSRIHLLASLLEDTAKRRSLQIIATTHSPTLLAHLSAEALADVLVFGRSPDDGTTIGKRLGDLPHFATLRDADNLDHLISTGWLEREL